MQGVFLHTKRSGASSQRTFSLSQRTDEGDVMHCLGSSTRHSCFAEHDHSMLMKVICAGTWIASACNTTLLAKWMVSCLTLECLQCSWTLLSEASRSCKCAPAADIQSECKQCCTSLASSLVQLYVSCIRLRSCVIESAQAIQALR